MVLGISVVLRGPVRDETGGRLSSAGDVSQWHGGSTSIGSGLDSLRKAELRIKIFDVVVFCVGLLRSALKLVNASQKSDTHLLIGTILKGDNTTTTLGDSED